MAGNVAGSTGVNMLWPLGPGHCWWPTDDTVRAFSETISRKAEIAQQLLAHNRGLPAQPMVRPADIRTADLRATEDRATEDDSDLSSRVAQVSETSEPGRLASPTVGRQRTRSSVPYMNPAWRRPLTDAKGPIIDAAVRRWQITQQRDDKAAIAVHSAVVVGAAVVFRNYDGICAVDGTTGRTLWNYLSGTSFVRAWTEAALAGSTSGDANSTDPALDSMMNSYAGNSILGTLTTDGRRILLQSIRWIFVRGKPHLRQTNRANRTRAHNASPAMPTV